MKIPKNVQQDLGIDPASTARKSLQEQSRIVAESLKQTRLAVEDEGIKISCTANNCGWEVEGLLFNQNRAIEKILEDLCQKVRDVACEIAIDQGMVTGQ